MGRDYKVEKERKSERERKSGREYKAGREYNEGRERKAEREYKAGREYNEGRERKAEREHRAGKNKEYISGSNKDTEAAKNKLCPVSSRCGGCQYIDYPYEKQLLKKQRMVEELIGKYVKVDRIIGMENPFHYRNKVHAVLDSDRGRIISGVYEAGTHNVIPVKNCCIENKTAGAIINTIVSLMPSFKIKAYCEDTGYGYLRHILVRTGHVTGEVMVVLVAADAVFPSKNNFIKALRAKHPEITTIVLNINNKNTSMVLGDREIVMYGKGFIEDELCGKRFIISPKSFYQVNPVQTEVLYSKAIEYAGLTGKERVIDAYCGIGTIGISLADKAGEVIGVELNPDAVRDAVKNARINKIKNITFYKNDAGVFMQEMAAQGEKADVVIMDPPRSGSTEQFINAAAVLSPEKIIYISCSVETLARDLEIFKKKGYKAVKAAPVDMFAMTGHVETVVKLVRKTPDAYMTLP